MKIICGIFGGLLFLVVIATAALSFMFISSVGNSMVKSEDERIIEYSKEGFYLILEATDRLENNKELSILSKKIIARIQEVAVNRIYEIQHRVESDYISPQKISAKFHDGVLGR